MPVVFAVITLFAVSCLDYTVAAAPAFAHTVGSTITVLTVVRSVIAYFVAGFISVAAVFAAAVASRSAVTRSSVVLAVIAGFVDAFGNDTAVYGYVFITNIEAVAVFALDDTVTAVSCYCSVCFCAVCGADLAVFFAVFTCRFAVVCTVVASFVRAGCNPAVFSEAVAVLPVDDSVAAFRHIA